MASLGWNADIASAVILAHHSVMAKRSSRPYPRLALALMSVGAVSGVFAFLCNFVASEHIGWVLHQWAAFFGLAILSTVLGAAIAGPRLRWFALMMLATLALSAIDPLRLIIIYGRWWDV